jgi:hypothetical protein
MLVDKQLWLKDDLSAIFQPENATRRKRKKTLYSIFQAIMMIL